MTRIEEGEELETYTVTPLENPVPEPEPTEAPVREPVRDPELVPA